MKKTPNFLKQFVIQFSGLKIGEHQFNLKAEKPFFEHFEIEDITDGNLEIAFTLIKRETMMELLFHVSGNLIGICDRCLDPLTIALNTERETMVKFGDESDFDNDDLIILGHDEYQLDIAPMIYEMAVLALPLRKVHNENECNPELTQHLNIEDSKSEEEQNDTPSIWDELKKINKN